MRFIKVFEKFGISNELEEQVEDIYKQINSEENKNKNEFSFIYYCDGQKYFFKIVVMSTVTKLTNLNTLGNFGVEDGKCIITLQKRSDKSTLLHEVKHLDYYLRKKDCFENLFYLGSQIDFADSGNDFKRIKEIFYLYDENEFQARYHGYYIGFDKYVRENISNNPTSGEILTLFKKFFKETKDFSWTWYISNRVFKFEDYFKQRTMRNILYKVGSELEKKDKTMINNLSFDGVLSYLKNGAVNLYNKILDIRPKHEEDMIRKYKSYFEKQINLKRKRYTKKMMKLVNIMIDKHVK